MKNGPEELTALGFDREHFRELLDSGASTEEVLDALTREFDRQMRHRSRLDPVTSLPNRGLFLDRLEQAIVLCREHDRELAVVLLDLDNFKMINDSLGHSQGDVVLAAVGGRLRRCIRATDTVARLGADEFALLLPVSSADTAAKVVGKLFEWLSKPFAVAGREIYLTASAGISMFPADGDQPEVLLRCSDTAVYVAKAQGRDSSRFYTPAMNEEASERLALETALRRSLTDGGFVLHYQARVDLSSGVVTGVEALIRWHHPDFGLLLPGRFLSVAKAAGLMPSIGEFVLRQAARQVREWRDAGLLNVSVAVNLSASQFRFDDLVDLVSEVIETEGLDAGWLELEITEDALIEDMEGATRQIERLKALGGLKVAIDDFGTGYSSLGYLKKLPVDILKIDRSFISDITGDVNTADVAIVKTVIALGRNMGLRVVAEGVETEEQLEVLRALDCDEAQGFLFAYPEPAEVLTAHLASGRLQVNPG